MIYLTSDTHFGHENIIKYVDRPFDSAKEMDETILNNINVVVKPDDTLYILGDFTMGGSYSKCRRYLEQINCNHVILILGNHDKRFLVHGKTTQFNDEKDYYEIKYKYTLFCLSHYPFLSWHGREQNAIMCHGHIHSKPRTNGINQWQRVFRYDVGVDANWYTPVSIEYIYKYFNTPLEEIFKLK